jgi:hypothetical protein
MIVCLTAYIALNHLNLNKDEFQTRRDKDKTTETLKHCNQFFNEMQVSFKDLISKKGFHGINLIWDKLDEISKESLEKYYKDQYELFRNLDKETRNQSLIVLYQLDAYAAYFLHGNLDINLGKRLIGYVYCQQVGFLKGLIAYNKPKEKQDKIFVNIVELLKIWEK